MHLVGGGPWTLGDNSREFLPVSWLMKTRI
jgi:hypothetical protein